MNFFLILKTGNNSFISSVKMSVEFQESKAKFENWFDSQLLLFDPSEPLSSTPPPSTVTPPPQAPAPAEQPTALNPLPLGGEKRGREREGGRKRENSDKEREKEKGAREGESKGERGRERDIG